MKFLTKLTAGFLLMSGFLCLMVSASALSQLPDKDQNTLEQQDATDTFVGGIAFGVPLVAGGGYMLWGLRRRNEKLLRDRLDSTFYQMLKANNGRITVLQLAMEAQLSGEQAKQYLDQKAKEFNATFEPSDQGNISYLFHL
jgi:large subunit ribosomal protein L7/L12